MRIAAMGLVLALGCGGNDGEAVTPKAASGSAGRPAVAGSGGSGGSGGGEVVAGSGGRLAAGTGGLDGGAAGEAQSSTSGQAGETGGKNGTAGHPSKGGSGGTGTTMFGGEAGVPVGEGGGSAGAPSACDCSASENCVDGQCVTKPECDCSALGVECSPLHAALGEAFACPVEVECGSCEAGSLCVHGITEPSRVCVEANTTSCIDDDHINHEFYGYGPDCPISGYPECTIAYSSCGTPVTASGSDCPAADGTKPGVYWHCGPAI